MLVKYPCEYDWDALATLVPTYRQLVRFYRMFLRGMNPSFVGMSDRTMLQDTRGLRSEMNLVSVMARKLEVTAKQRSKFAHLAGIACSWQYDDDPFADEGDTDDSRIILQANSVWSRLLTQKVTLAWFREATAIVGGVECGRLDLLLEAHSLGMNPQDAQICSGPEYRRMFTSAQIRSLAHHKLSLPFAYHIFETARYAGTHPTVQEVVELRDAAVPHEYLTALLSAGQTAHATARLWKQGVPAEYAIALA